MKRFITLILMLSILFTFTQKVMAAAPLLNAETASISMVNCTMPMANNDSHMEMGKTECTGHEMPHTMDCQNSCDFMTVVSVLYFVEHNYSIEQTQLRLSYPTDNSLSPYYFPESLYRPPFLA